MRTRKKRLAMSMGALLIALVALAGAPAGAVVPPAPNYCNDAGGCGSCGGDECDDIGECNTHCLPICLGGQEWVGCTPDD